MIHIKYNIYIDLIYRKNSFKKKFILQPIIYLKFSFIQ